MQWTVVSLASFTGFTVCLAAFVLLFDVLLSWPTLAREWQPLWQIL